MTISRAASIEHPGGATVAARPGRTLLLRARELRGPLSLAAAAKRIGIRPDELGRIERGETKQVRWETLLGMAAAYEVEVGDLLVATSWPGVDPAYAPILAALRSGELVATMPPRRFTTDPDVLLAERDAERDLETLSATEVAAFAETEGAACAEMEPARSPEIRRPAFQPTRR